MDRRFLPVLLLMFLFVASFASAEVAVITQQNDTSVEYKIDNGWWEWLPDWLGGETVAIFTKDYSYNSLTQGYAGGHGEFFESHQLIDDINFYNRLGENINSEVFNVKISYAQAENVTYEVPQYEEVCEEITGNATNGTTYTSCYANLTGYVDEVREEWNFKEYNGEEIIGKFQWKLEATYPKGEDVDWVLTVFGQELLKWDWWDSNWEFKKELTDLNGSISALYTITKDNISNENFSSIRFLDYATESIELDYDIAFENATHVGVRLNNYGADKAYMYYGNDAATDQSNASAVYLNPVAIWYLDETSGIVTDRLGARNETSSSGKTSGQQGKIDKSIDMSGASSYVYIGGSYPGGNDPVTMMGWVNLDSNVGNTFAFGYGNDATNEMLAFKATSTNWFLNTGNADIDTGVSTVTNEWVHLAFVHTGSYMQTYTNGVLRTNTSKTMNKGSTQMTFGNYPAQTGSSLNGKLDEVYIYDYALNSTEVQILYNQTQPDFTLGVEQIEGAQITLVQPADALQTNDSSVDFSCNATFDTNIANLTLVIDGADNYTNATIGTDITLDRTLSLADGAHTWSCRATTVSEATTQSANRTLTIDTTLPAISISSPLTAYDFLYNNQTLDLNWSINDTNLDSCWYTYNGVSNNLTCNDNTTTFQYVAGVNNITLYANDTFGNENSLNRAWIPKVTEKAQAYTNPVLSSVENIFSTNITTGTGYTINSAEFVYNGTSYAPTVVSPSTREYYLTYTALSPLVVNDTNYTFYWNVTLNDASEIKINENTQEVLAFTIDDCSNYTNILFNFTMVDEATQSFLSGTGDNTSIKLDFQLSTATGDSLPINISKDFNKINPAAICSNIELSDATYLLDGVVEYSSANRFVEFYNIEQYELTESTDNQNITLYNLLESEGQEFKITYKGEDFVPVADVLVQIQRKYIDEGVFKVIEIPMSGSNGYTIAHLVPNDVIYNLILLKDGEVLDSFVDVIASCQNPSFTECEINLNALISGNDLVALVEESDIFSSLTYDYDTRTVSTTYGIISGASTTATLNVTIADNLGTTQLCSDTLIAAGGTLSCEIPGSFGNTTVHAQLILDDEVRREGYVSLTEKPKDRFNGAIMFMAIIMVLFLVGIGVQEEPKYMVIFLILGVIILGAMNIIYTTSWLGAGATILWFIIALVTILIKGGNKR